MRYFILLPEDTEEDVDYSTNILGEVSFKNFWTEEGFGILERLVEKYPDTLIFRTWWWQSHRAGTIPLERNLPAIAQEKNNPAKPFFKDFDCMIWPVHTKLTTGEGHWYMIVAYPKTG